MPQRFESKNFNDKPVATLFYSTSCGNCVQALKDFKKIRTKGVNYEAIDVKTLKDFSITRVPLLHFAKHRSFSSVDKVEGSYDIRKKLEFIKHNY